MKFHTSLYKTWCYAVVFGLALAVLTAPSAAAADGALDQVRKETHRDSKRSRSDSGSNSRSSSDNDSNLVGNIISGLFGIFFSGDSRSPGGRSGHTDHGFEPPSPRIDFFLPYPYASGRPGYVRILSETERDLLEVHTHRNAASPYRPSKQPIYLRETRPDGSMHWVLRNSAPPLAQDPATARRAAEFAQVADNLKTWSVQLSIDNSHDFGWKLNTTRFSLRITQPFGFGLDTSWAYLHEELAGGATDQLGLSDLNLTFSLAVNPYLRPWLGGGGNFLLDGSNSVSGWNFTIGCDLFPAQPLVVRAEFDAGNLGNTGYLHFRGEMGVVWKHGELYGGYDLVRIGTVDIQGPVVGLRFWF